MLKCIVSSIDSGSVCEGGTLSLNCKTGEVIQIVSTAYGNIDNNCYSETFYTSICPLANGNSQYSIKINQGVFQGIPNICPGQRKCARVVYNCLPVSLYVNANSYLSGNDFSQIKLTCPTNQIIQFVSLFYGNTATNCYSATFANNLRNSFSGRNQFNLTAGVGVSDDPCYGTVKNTQISYNCGSSLDTGFVCEGSMLSLPCVGNSIAQVQSASYGNQVTNCFSDSFQNIFSQFVNGFKPIPSVLVNASNFLSKDPCPGKLKCARVIYNCLYAGGTKYNVPDRSLLSISCPTNKVLQLVGSWYGYSPKFCYSTSFQGILSRQANGKNQYSFTVGDSVFGSDPCPGITKYAYVSWNCVTQQNYFTAQYLLYTKMNPTEAIDVTLNT